jgi:[ribosomal protein S5]-alanine N-acetyltransferase
MLQGRLTHLRPVRESDLDAMYAAHVNIADRGPHFPLGVLSEPAFRREFAEHGFWQRDEGISYWDAFELSYQLYGDCFAGRGYATEAVQLLVDYLFATKQRYTSRRWGS